MRKSVLTAIGLPAFLALPAVSLFLACSSSSPATSADGGATADDASSGQDSSQSQGDAGGSGDAGQDAQGAHDASQDGSQGGQDSGGTQDAGTVFTSNFGDATKWATFDTTLVDTHASGFRGAAFDGRYLYLVPFSNGSGLDGVVTRYDTQASFAATSSWTTFDVSALSANAVGFTGATFDGRYIYFVPQQNNSSAGAGGVVARYDTQAPFGTATSWTAFDLTAASGNSKAADFAGAVFDGRYVYLMPAISWGIVAQYDTQAGFTTASSWTLYDTSSQFPALSMGYWGGGFDGRYMYMADNANATYAGELRYDTQASFTATASWTDYQVPDAFVGTGFDGRYTYFVGSVVSRYDTTASAFTAVSAWSNFDLGSNFADAGAGSGFQGAAFDGRYLYLAPEGSNNFQRYDTKASFTAAASWEGASNSNAGGFLGAAFDGRYVYFVPTNNGVVSRFDAVTGGSIPQLCSSAAALHCYSGSFF